MRPNMLEAILLILAADGAATTPAAIAEPNPRAMTPKQIRAFNATVPRDHPYYIRCVSKPETGSLVKKITSCRTNEQWAKADAIGNQNARDTYEAMTSKATNSN